MDTPPEQQLPPPPSPTLGAFSSSVREQRPQSTSCSLFLGIAVMCMLASLFWAGPAILVACRVGHCGRGRPEAAELFPAASLPTDRSPAAREWTQGEGGGTHLLN